VKFIIAIHRAERILDYVFTDVWGPTKMTSLGGMHFFVSFIDDFSRCYWVYKIRHRGEICIWSGRSIWRNTQEGRRYSVRIIMVITLVILSYNYAVMRE